MASAAFTIVQHATHKLAFHKEYLSFLEKEYRMGRVPGEPVALLTDRTRQAGGRPQLYGTQISIRDGKLQVDPIEDEDNVDRRRRALGLPSLAVYIEEVRAIYGISDADADRPWRFAPGVAEHPGRVPATLPEATRKSPAHAPTSDPVLPRQGAQSAASLPGNRIQPAR